MKKFFLCCCLAGLVGCAAEVEEKPADLLPPEKITSLLADIHIAESQVESMGIHPDTAKAFFNQQQKEILRKHNTTQEQFDKSYTYYQEHLVQLDNIYEALIDTLGMREIKLSAK